MITVRFTDDWGAVNALLLALAVSTTIGAIQGYFIAYLRIRAIVLTVGTLMLLRGVALFAADEKTVMLTDFRIPDFISTKMLVYFSPASLLVIAMFIIVGLFMTFTRYGREIYAIGGARKEALASGISLQRPMIIVFAISGFCAGLGGIIIGLRSGTAQALGLQYLLLAGTVAAFIGGVSILGGKGGVIGAAIGTLTVNFLNTGLVFNVTPLFHGAALPRHPPSCRHHVPDRQPSLRGTATTKPAAQRCRPTTKHPGRQDRRNPTTIRIVTAKLEEYPSRT